MDEKSKTDKLLFKIKNNKLIAYVIVFAIITLAFIKFFNEITSFVGSIGFSKEKEFSKLDYLQAKYHPDTLLKYNQIHELVSRRDYVMDFYIPIDQDSTEPLDGPAGLRFKTYFLPQKPNCIIGANAEIVCLKTLMESEDTSSINFSEQVESFKFLIGLDSVSPDIGYCNLDDYVNYRINNTRKESENFELLFNSPATRIFIHNDKDYFLVESKRIKFKFLMDGQQYYVMEFITYFDELAFSLFFGAPEKDYNKYEDMFIDITNNCYFKEIGL